MEIRENNSARGVNEQMVDIKLPFLLSGNHRAFPIEDDSMPPLHKGNLIICKLVESYTEITDGATYVIITKPWDIVYRRIKKHSNKKETFVLDPDNRIYQTSEVKGKDIIEIWEFVCSLHIDAYKPGELNIDSVMKMLRALKVEIKAI